MRSNFVSQNQGHLLITKLLLPDDDISKVMGAYVKQYPKTIKLSQLNEAGIFTAADLLNTRLHICAVIEGITIEAWQAIFRECKVKYRDCIQQVRWLSTQEKLPHEIEQLGLSQRTTRALVDTGITNFEQIACLTFADIIYISRLDSWALGELIKVLQDKSVEELPPINCNPRGVSEVSPHPPTIWPSMRAAYERQSKISSNQQKLQTDNVINQITDKDQLVWEIKNRPDFGRKLVKADLEETDLSRAYLYRADLSWANLRGANLQGANLTEANLMGTNLQKVNLKEVNLRGATLIGADLKEANLSGLNLFMVDLTQADLRDVNLDATRLSNCKLYGANLSRVKLYKAHLNWANLAGTNLSEVDLSGANLNGVDLREADLTGADLRGADLRKAKIDERTQLGHGKMRAKLDNTTHIPDKWRLTWGLAKDTEQTSLKSSLSNRSIGDGLETIQSQTHASVRDILDLEKNNISSSTVETRSSEISSRKREYLLAIEFHLITHSLSNVVGDYPQLIKQLNNANIFTIDDLLNSYLHECAKIENIAIETWGKIFKRFKQGYIWRLDRVRKLGKGTSPYAITQLGLSRQTVNCLIITGITNFEQLTKLTFADVFCIKQFGSSGFGQVLSVFRNELRSLNSESPYENRIKGLEDHSLDSTNILDCNQTVTSLHTSVETLPLSIRARNMLMRNGIQTIHKLLKTPDSEIESIRNVGTQTFAEILAIKKQILAATDQVIHIDEKQLPLSETRVEVPARVTISKSNHLLANDFPQQDSELYTIVGNYPDVVKELNDIAVYTADDLLNSRLYECVIIRQITLEIWEKIFTELKKAYRGIIRTGQRLSIKKSHPYEIEQLELSTRTENCLFRAGIIDFYLLTRLTFADALCIKNFGPLTLSEIIAVLREKRDVINSFLSKESSDKILQIPNEAASNVYLQDTLISLSDYQFLKQMGIPLDKIKVSRLALPVSTEGILKILKIDTIDTLVTQGKTVLKANIGIKGEEHIRILTKSLKTYCTWLPTQANWDEEVADKGISPLYWVWLKETTLEKLIDNLLSHLSNEKYRTIIRLRFGLDGGGLRTLEQIGKTLGLSKQRIRQIEHDVMGKLLIKSAQDGLIRALHISIGNEMKTQGGLMTVLQLQKPVADLTGVGEIDLDGAILLLLSLRPSQFIQLDKGKRWGLKDAPLNLIGPLSGQLIESLDKVHGPLSLTSLIEQLKNSNLTQQDDIDWLVSSGFIEACLSTNDYFEMTEDSEWSLTQWRKGRTEEIVKALRKLGKPSHFTEIAAIANEMLPPSQRASARVYHAQLSNKPHLFIWVGSGTFGLVEWGLKRTRFYRDIAEELLQNRGEPLSFEEIFPVIKAEREASPESIKFMLANSRFRQYPNNKYGLASWTEESEDGDEVDTDDDFFDDLKRKLFDDLSDENED